MRILFITYPACQSSPYEPIRYQSYFNTGDAVYFFPLMSYIDCPDNDVDYVNYTDVIRNMHKNRDYGKSYDIAIHPHANILVKRNEEEMLRCAWMYRNLDIPVYVIGAGCDAGIAYDTSALRDCEQNVKIFIDAIFNRGGVSRVVVFLHKLHLKPSASKTSLFPVVHPCMSTENGFTSIRKIFSEKRFVPCSTASAFMKSLPDGFVSIRRLGFSTRIITWKPFTSLERRRSTWIFSGQPKSCLPKIA